MTLKREIKDAYLEGGASIYVKTHSNAIYVDDNETETLTQRLDNVKDSITAHTSQLNNVKDSITAHTSQLNNVKDSITAHTTQLETKANLNSVFNMANMGQDIKDAMTGGSVAVVGKNTVLNDNIVNKAISFNKTNFIEIGKNLLNPDTLLYGFYIEGNGTLKPHDNYVATDYIPFSNGQSISFNRNVNGNDNSFREIRRATFYNSNFEPLPTLAYDNSSAVSEPLNCPSDASVKYVRLSLGKGYIDSKSMLHYGNSVEEIEPFYYSIRNLKIPVKTNNPLYGKKIIGFGDSIMRGAGNNDVGIVDILAERNNMEVTNLAVSGATIMNTQTNNIPTQIDNCTQTADYVLLDGYINYCLSNDVITNLGTVSPYYGSNDFGTTFCGQLENMIKKLHKKFLGAKFLYIFVHKMGTRDDEIVKPVHEKAKEICNKWSIPVVDLYEESIMNTYIDEYKIYTGNNGDKTHPNNLGYTKYYIPPIEAKLKSL